MFIFQLFDSTDHVPRLGSRGVKPFYDFNNEEWGAIGDME